MAAKTPTTKKIITLRHATGTPHVRLICIPYAGGNPELFLPWADSLNHDIELLAVRLPGHGPRIAEPTFDQWDPLLDDLLEGLAGYMSEPHALYGHCFGGRLAYEITHLAAARDAPQTRRLFVSACRSPDTPHRGHYVHKLPDSEFRSVLRERGASEEVLRNDAVMRMLIPAVRSEIRLAELWDDRHGVPVDVPITAIYGRDDAEDGRLSMLGWKSFTTEGCEFVEMPGRNHLGEHERARLLEVINTRLEGVT